MHFDDEGGPTNRLEGHTVTFWYTSDTINGYRRKWTITVFMKRKYNEKELLKLLNRRFGPNVDLVSVKYQ